MATSTLTYHRHRCEKTQVLPPDIDPDLLSHSLFKTSMGIKEGDHKVVLDSRQEINDINKNGVCNLQRKKAKFGYLLADDAIVRKVSAAGSL